MSKLAYRMLVLALIAGVLAGCSPVGQPAAQPTGQPTNAPVTGGTVTRALTSEPPAIDPQGAAASGLNLVLPYLFDPLVFRETDNTFKPYLAESWQTAADGKSITFRLKKGVTFHDGSPLNAAAVVFTFERFKKTGSKSPIYGGITDIASVEAVDDLTVRFSFEKPSATFLGTLSQPYAGILSPAAVQAAGAEVGRKPVGTGLFKLGEWKAGVSITLVRNPNYAWAPPSAKNQGAAKVDKLVFQVIPDASTQLAALQAGEVDVIFINDPAHFQKLEADSAIQVRRATLDSLIYLGYNCAKPPFNEVKVRQALSYAVNKAEIIKLALGGLGEPANTLLPPTLAGYNADLARFGQGYDPAKAMALLKEAGFTQAADGSWQRDGKRLGGTLLTSTRAPNDVIATVLQGQLKAVGVVVEIQQLDSAAVMKATTDGTFDLLLWRYDWNDPDVLNMYLSTSRIKQTNRTWYSNPQADALLESGARELDPKKRDQIYYDAQKLLLSESPWQPLYIPVEGMAIRNRVSGVGVGSMGRMLMNDATISATINANVK
jgi:peptide/nickel transport system substrate-binding protein